jgi:DNA polymerase III delta subunit
MSFVLSLLHGKDQASLKSHLLELLDSIPPEEKLLSTSRHDLSDKAQMGAAWSALRTPPLPLGASPTRWVILEAVDALKDAAVVGQLDSALESATLWAKSKQQHLRVICCATDEVGANPALKPITARVKKKDNHEFVRLPPWQFGKQLEATKALVAELGIELKPVLVNELTRLTGGDQNRIRAELHKLGPLVAAGAKVTVPVLRELLGQAVVTTRDLVDAVREDRRGRLLELAQQMLAGGAAPWEVAGSLVGQLHPLLLLTALSDQDDNDVAKLLAWKKGRVWAQRKELGQLNGPGLLKLSTRLLAFRYAITAGKFPGQAEQQEGLLLALAEGITQR